MNKHKLRSRLVGAASIGFVAATAALLIGSGAAYAAGGVPADPPGGATPTYPQFYNGNVEQIRSSGSDTTIFMMQTIADLYTAAGLYGCTLGTGSGTNYNSSDPAEASTNEGYYCLASSNQATTDTEDNWDRTEVDTGVDLVGSGNGQKQLCGTLSTPLPVDLARSSKPIDAPASPVGSHSPACATIAEVGYAKDGVPMVDFQTLNPSAFGTTSPSGVYSSINDGDVGPVADGWLPTDPVGGPYHGTALTNISNADNGGEANSTVYRLYCASGASQMTDWGQLTNLGPTLAVVNATVSSGSLTAAPEASLDGSFTGSTAAITFPANVDGASVSGTGVPANTTVSSGAGSTTLTLSNSFSVGPENLTITLTGGQTEASGQGVPDGIPVRLQGVNTNSGTEATMQLYANSGAASGCGSNVDQNADADPNPATGGGAVGGSNPAPQALENNAAQLAQYAESYFPADAVDQAIEVGTTLYFESNGVYNTDPYAGETQLWSSGTPGSGTSDTYTASKISENGETTTTPNLLNNFYPTARTLFNMYLTNEVRDATAGFINWICETNGDNTTDGNGNAVNKAVDNSNGLNYDQMLTTIITGQYGFPRLTDESANPSNGGTPADLQPAPNTTCASALNSGGTAGDGRPPIGDPENGGTAPPNP